MERIDCVVIGAGVVGLAVARVLALAGREVVVLEAETGFGRHTSSRSSEVIHAGIYYPSGSLKARLCVAGRQRLYRYCERRGIPHRRIGKLLLAVRSEDKDRLRALAEQGRINGVEELAWLDKAALAEREPALEAVAALWSPCTGIVDSHALMLALLADAEAQGARLAVDSAVSGGAATSEGIVLQVNGGYEVLARTVVNAAGLRAHAVAASLGGVAPESIPAVRYARGNYFSLGIPCPFSHLIYPVPEPGGLGTHLTLDVSGQARFGPDVEWVEGIDYSVDAGRAKHFYHSVRRWWPGLPEGALAPAYSGIRPKLGGLGQKEADFVVHDVRQHRVPGLVNLYGIESPGLTAALALAETVAGGCLL
ncbi:NAD(P)/FAD-dependent oxidoreductase [Gulbenkiania mobilis]|uniref:L-2-hydroxyglutarate oxidase LhgO n=1 Tax=Gulbenkiania mobilis TaxID=397457 RepID=A0ABY2CZ36_GULMO|nr:L-2-hydroxyglutarate oxidase LhgO [Gulbenkiania mobilis]